MACHKDPSQIQPQKVPSSHEAGPGREIKLLPTRCLTSLENDLRDLQNDAKGG